MTNQIKSALGRLTLCGAAVVLALGLAGTSVRAQDASASQAQTQGQAPSDQKLTEGQLEQLVAPIALYPDPLLTQVVMASTYPLEIVEAARWSRDNPGMNGAALQSAMQTQPWDPSVKALAAVPQTLQMMNDKLDWTQQLGDAFLAQQQDVMNAVQTLRAESQAAGNLQSNAQQRVTTEPAPAGVSTPSRQQAIVIAPVDPDVYYVPVYDPAAAYGTWGYPDYPPFFWSPPGFVASNVVSFAAGIAVGAAIWGGCDWWHNNVIINVNRFNAFNRTDITNNIWAHNPAHRGDVPYRNAAVAERFGRGNTLAARDALKDHMDAGRSELSREADHKFDGAGQAAKAIGAAGLARRAPDGAKSFAPRSAARQANHAAMPARSFNRPMAAPRAQFMRSRAEAFRPAPRSFARGGGFGGGRHRL
ncbi:DUF3300 domain-containing protein [Bradyrhizobium sp. McL0616]|uniref:DUF3300 domain-containing protein n=1 Tax=Bradyrhizobium sp. McL0616 TaxID=3415674 RepID=UPI003CF2D0E4